MLLIVFSDPNLPEWDNAAQDRGDSVFFTGERWPKYNASSQSYLHIGKYPFLPH
jgi:hypothetical protein